MSVAKSDGNRWLRFDLKLHSRECGDIHASLVCKAATFVFNIVVRNKSDVDWQHSRFYRNKEESVFSAIDIIPNTVKMNPVKESGRQAPAWKLTADSFSLTLEEHLD